MGIEATQATLSRALRELSIENTSGKWRKSEKVESLMELEKMFSVISSEDSRCAIEREFSHNKIFIPAPFIMS